MKYTLITLTDNGIELFDLDGETFDEACESADSYESQGYPSIWVASKDDLINLKQKISDKINY